MKIKPVDLYENYLLVNKTERATCKQSIIKIKKDLGFETKKIGGLHHFVYTNKQLMKMFSDKGWIDEMNDYIDDDRDVTTKFYDNTDSDSEEPTLTKRKISKSDINIMDSDEEDEIDDNKNISKSIMDSDDEEDEDEIDNNKSIGKSIMHSDEEDEEACTELTKTDVTDLLDCFHVDGDEDDDEYE
jgi:hypothetical protein